MNGIRETLLRIRMRSDAAGQPRAHANGCIPNRGGAGFTLLELLVVVFILSAIAFSTVSFTNNADEQFRFEDTRTRLVSVRTAVAGQPLQTLNGEPAVSGFVADVGRLPDTLQELIENVGVPPLPAWSFDAGVGLWAGWRGPYLAVLTEQGGSKTFHDGWGSAGGAPTYGWMSFDVADFDVPPDGLTDTLAMQSFGSDAAAGGTGYAADYPPAGADTLVDRDDHQLNLKGWSVTVTFRNPANGGPALPQAVETVRVRVFYPQEGSFAWPATWPPTPGDRDGEEYLSLALSLASGEVPDGGTVDKVFSFGIAVEKFIPWGVRSLVVVRDADGTTLPLAGQHEVLTMAPRTSLPAVAMTWNLE